MGWAIATGTSSHSFFLISFLFLSNIATKYAYKFSKGCAQLFRSYVALVGNGMDNSYRYELWVIFLNLFFILFKYSYEICIQVFEMLRSAIPKLCHFR